MEDYERFRSFDLAFHAAVMKASGSEIGRTIVRTIHMHAGRPSHLTAPGARASLERTVADHRAIYEALAAATASSRLPARQPTSTRPGPSAARPASEQQGWDSLRSSRIASESSPRSRLTVFIIRIMIIPSCESPPSTST